ncbi:MAG: GPR endopeptidase [Acutalibacteraceae bacterium]|nr:GPR endopeptidase [Acutalibacteraceae bacterium]
MTGRSDLAVELKDNIKDGEGINCETEKQGILSVTRIKITNKKGAEAIGKPQGSYINIDIPDLLYHGGDYIDLEKIIINECSKLSTNKDNFLVAGLGNRNITPDALGPKVAERILATRHISDYIRKQTGLERLKNVSVIQPGVLGQTGVETVEILRGVISASNASCLIVIDSFAAADAKRLGTTIQICDSGISPGSGVGNDRKEISEKTVGIPVIAIGVPTCLDAALFSGSSQKGKKAPMIVTPREIDLLIDRASNVISNAVNCFLQPDTERNLLLSIV